VSSHDTLLVVAAPIPTGSAGSNGFRRLFLQQCAKRLTDTCRAMLVPVVWFEHEPILTVSAMVRTILNLSNSKTCKRSRQPAWNGCHGVLLWQDFLYFERYVAK